MWNFPLISWILSLTSIPPPKIIRRYHTLTVQSDPIIGVPFTIDDSEVLYTPWEGKVEEGEHLIIVGDVAEVDSAVFFFARWENLSTDPERIITVDSDKTIKAYFIEVPVPEQYSFST